LKTYQYFRDKCGWLPSQVRKERACDILGLMFLDNLDFEKAEKKKRIEEEQARARKIIEQFKKQAK